MYLPAALTGAPLPPAQALRGVSPLVPATQAGRDFLATLAGRSVAALVLGRAEDGHGIVEIEGHQITVAADLPPRGTRVTLRFADGAAAPATGATALVRGATPVLPAGLAANDSDVAVELGEGALSLGRFAETPLEPLRLGQVKADVETPVEWAQALARLVRDSGTFYESHLAAWSQGGYPLEQLRNEPQAETGRPPAPPAVPGLPQEAVATMRADAVTMPTQAHMATSPSSGAQDTGVPETLQPVIREQLHALETQTVPFSVEAWPGQRADLVIGREPEGQSTGADAAAGGWKTQLKLQLPQLGSIAATLTLQGDRLWLDLAAPQESAAALNAAGGSLSNAMLVAGIRLVRTRVLGEG
ncbi:MAG TPA: flagellar hook-length control protein FliK [Burkholderiales bacterium]|jgi:hypothetical protein